MRSMRVRTMTMLTLLVGTLGVSPVGLRVAAGEAPRSASIQWTVFPAEPRGASIASFDGSAADHVWAVGLRSGGHCQYQTLAQHWDGTDWTVVPIPNEAGVNSVLNAVSVLTPDNVWAVGESACPAVQEGRPLVEHWNGHAWKIVPSPPRGDDAVLHAVAAVAPDDVWAVGGFVHNFRERPLMEHWDGRSWTGVGLSGEGSLSGISASPDGDVWAVGTRMTSTSDAPIAFHLEGSTWTATPVPTRDDHAGYLSEVVAVSATEAWAVGGVRPEGSKLKPLIERWDGTSWSEVAAPHIPGFCGLNAVDRVPGGGLWAAGFTVDQAESRAVVLRRHGAGWVEVNAPATNYLFALAVLPHGELWTNNGGELFHGAVSVGQN